MILYVAEIEDTSFEHLGSFLQEKRSTIDKIKTVVFFMISVLIVKENFVDNIFTGINVSFYADVNSRR